MRIAFPAVLALTALLSSQAYGAPATRDLTYSVPVAGRWSFGSVDGGAEAIFRDSSGTPQLSIRCTRTPRRIQIRKAATKPSAMLWIWTSAQSKDLPAAFDPSTRTIVAELSAFDPVLDAMASSRGRLGIGSSDLDVLVAPPWAEVGRVIEDCRA
jgi:hypothetical protein